MSQQPVVPSALRGSSVSVEAQNIQTMNPSLICTNRDRLHHYLISDSKAAFYSSLIDP